MNMKYSASSFSAAPEKDLKQGQMNIKMMMSYIWNMFSWAEERLRMTLYTDKLMSCIWSMTSELKMKHNGPAAVTVLAWNL